MFTLEQIAWFDRCLFPDDFKQDLIKVGCPEIDATVISSYLKRNPSSSIVNIYQEFITDKDYTNYINQVLHNFITRGQDHE